MTASPLRSIRLTSHISPRRGYDARPRFDSDVWSLMLAHQAEIKEVYVFANAFWCGSARRLRAEGRVSQRVTRLCAFVNMTDIELHELRDWTNGDGHLSVLYAVQATSDLLPRLVNLYPRGRDISDERRDDLGLKDDEAQELRSIVLMNSPEQAVVSFATNADPCYIFSASPDALLLVLDRAALLATPTLR